MQLKDWQIAFKNFLQDKAEARFKVTPAAALNIYKNNYFSSLYKAIEAKFPITTISFSSEIKQLISEYININPSKEGNLGLYGESFPKFLRNKNLIASEIAKIELTIFKSYHSPQETFISLEELTHINPSLFDQLFFTFNKSVSLLPVCARAYELWQQGKNSLTPKEALSFPIKPVYLISYIKNYQAKLYPLSKGQFAFLAAIKRSCSVLQAGKIALKADKKFNLTESLGFCFRNNLIYSFNLKNYNSPQDIDLDLKRRII